MKHLYLSYAEQRRLHGMDTASARPRASSRRSRRSTSKRCDPASRWPGPAIGVARFREPVAEPSAPGIKLGARVRHARFGDGVILNLEGQGPQARVQVNFEKQGSKWLMLSYANLEDRALKVLILGAGQVGRTAAYHLAREPANEVTVVDTNEELLRDLQERIGRAHGCRQRVVSGRARGPPASSTPTSWWRSRAPTK